MACWFTEISYEHWRSDCSASHQELPLPCQHINVLDRALASESDLILINTYACVTTHQSHAC